MNMIAAVIACLLLVGGLSACGQVHGVSSAKGTNLEGSPGTANDLTTGGRGNDAPRGDHP
jgi:hypothetical protein